LRLVHETIVAVEKQKVLHICVHVQEARAWAYACGRVVFIIQHAMRRRIVICGLSGSTTFVDII
jgi:hypothetical protein